MGMKDPKDGSKPEAKQVEHGGKVTARRPSSPRFDVVDFKAGRACDRDSRGSTTAIGGLFCIYIVRTVMYISCAYK
jgi:hypothetical protein